MLRGMVIVLCGVGCLREPAFNGPRDADPDGDAGGDGSMGICSNAAPNQVSIQPINTGARVCGPNYHFEFSSQGAHFPYQMDIGGTALMGDGLRCNDERAVGIGLYPALKINGDNDGGSGTLGIELGSTTDAIAKVALTWTGGYTCSAGTGQLGTRSTFTFFPDGRVHRFDSFTHPANMATGACNVCEAGTANDPFYLTTFTTVAVDLGGVQVLGASGGDHTALGTQGASITAGSDTCITTRQRSIAFAWRNLNNVQTSSGTRVRAARLPAAGQTGAFAFTYDQLNGQPTISPTSANAFIHTTMLLADQTTSCATLLNRTPEYAAVARQLNYMRMGGTSQPMGYGLDGIYGGEQDGNPNRGQDIPGAAGVPVILTAGPQPLNAFAVWLELAVFHPSFTLTRSFGTGTDWYRMQRATGLNGQTQVIFWFPEGMPANQTITIDPEDT